MSIETEFHHPHQVSSLGATDSDAPAIISKEITLLEKVIRKMLVVSNKEVSPLVSCKTFEELNLRIDLQRGVFAMGYKFASKFQVTVLPALLADPPKNMIAQSQSGTGKTAAFVLAMLSRVDVTKNYPQIICVNPTYELAIQTGEVAAKMSQFCPNIKIKFAVRGEEVARDGKLTDHILIGTPEKLMDWALKFKIFNVKMITVFVLDEADVMFSTQRHQDHCIRLHEQLSKDCQMLLFSATYDTDVMEFAEMIIPNPLVIRLLREEEMLNNIKQYYIKCENPDEKYNAITNMYGVISIGQAIIFCHTCRTASCLANKMCSDGHSVSVLSSELTAGQRINVLDRFRSGVEKVLITTNVLSRGIDVEQVTIIVNFDLPIDLNGIPDYETYLHRIGRTGRFGKSGIALNLIDSPQSMMICQDIERHFGRKIRYLDAEDTDEIENIGN